MFDFRSKKVLSVILSSCTLGCLSSFFAVNGAGNIVKVAANDGRLVATATDESQLVQENEGDVVINAGGDSSQYSLLGNTIYYGEYKNLIKTESVLPGHNDDFQLFIRAVKVKDGLGNEIEYDPNTSNPNLDTGWIANKGLATLNFLRSSAGLWKTFCYPYCSMTKEGALGLTSIVLDESRSIPGREVYNLYTNDGKPIVPDLPTSSTTPVAQGQAIAQINSFNPPFPPFPPFPPQYNPQFNPQFNH